MSTDLEDALRTSGDLTLDRPLTEIRVRGDRLRRRRTSLLIAATTACALVAGLVVTTIVGRGPLATELAPAEEGKRPVLTWSGEPTNVSDTELATIQRACLPMADQDAKDTKEQADPSMPGALDRTTLYPIFAERRTDVGPRHESYLRAMFHTDDYLMECAASTTDASRPRAEDVAGGADRIRPFPRMGPWEAFSRSWTESSVTFMLPVPAEAASVKFTIGDGYVDGVINGGIAVAWLSAEGVPNELESAGFAVYDADGTRIGGEMPVPDKKWPVD
ncbi:hypothetical protein WBG06_24020 [Nocardioides sp. CCNWLW239]|uniref:hypothetical protein n=1 Tax=Nocardioides sp. CCNWLW239 TaxID=3128902 RepID=UPI00301B042E